MKQNIAYVFPNISTFNRNGRGGLHKRYEIAQEHGCDFIEVPADFIKNRTEVQITKKDLGSVLSTQDIQKLYDPGTPSKKVKYILHTEPQFSRRNGKGVSCTPRLQWNNRKWVQDFANMAAAISKRFTIAPAIIEIHPGGKHNTYSDIVRSINTIRKTFQKSFNVIPIVALENRTGQCISTGEQIHEFWRTLLFENNALIKDVGIVLDIQQLYTVTKDNFLKHLYRIPHESVKGLHIHCRHRTPSVGNRIPWKEVFAWLWEIEHKLFLNPEVHHYSQVVDTIYFCNEMIEKTQQQHARDGEKHSNRTP